MAGLKIDLNKDVSLNVKSRGSLPTKTSINLVPKKEKIMSTPQGRIKVLGSILIALILIGLLIVRPLIGLVGANARAAALQSELEDVNSQIAKLANVEEEYAHYTTEDMTAEELGRVDRVEIMDLVQDALVSGGVAKRWSLSGNVMTLEVGGTSLAELNQIAARLEEEPIVERCVINTANKGTNATSTNVAASFVIYLTKPAGTQDSLSSEADEVQAETGEEDNDDQ